MIAYLEGRLFGKKNDSVVIVAAGVGYRVFVSKQVMGQLPLEGEQVVMDVHTHVREDAIQLFGFLDSCEREVFEAIITISGMGPRAALSVLSGIEADEFARAVCSEDVARLCRIPGVGKKKAERMCLDLRDKLMPLAQKEQTQQSKPLGSVEDLCSALTNLGFKAAQVEQTIVSMKKQLMEESRLEMLLPEALRLLRG